LLCALACEHLLLSPQELLELRISDAPHLDEQAPEIGPIAPPALLAGYLGKLVHRDQVIVHSQSAQQRASFRFRHLDDLYRR
jgi:hypothetical protein